MQEKTRKGIKIENNDKILLSISEQDKIKLSNISENFHEYSKGSYDVDVLGPNTRIPPIANCNTCTGSCTVSCANGCKGTCEGTGEGDCKGGCEGS